MATSYKVGWPLVSLVSGAKQFFLRRKIELRRKPTSGRTINIHVKNPLQPLSSVTVDDDSTVFYSTCSILGTHVSATNHVLSHGSPSLPRYFRCAVNVDNGYVSCAWHYSSYDTCIIIPIIPIIPVLLFACEEDYCSIVFFSFDAKARRARRVTMNGF